MDDYHEFKHDHDIQIEEWWLYQSPNYVSITRGIMAPSGAMTTPNISLASGSKSVSGGGATESGGTTKGGGIRASINMPLHASNLVVKFFQNLWQNYQKG
jgi:hypothetical protein